MWLCGNEILKRAIDYGLVSGGTCLLDAVLVNEVLLMIINNFVIAICL